MPDDVTPANFGSFQSLVMSEFNKLRKTRDPKDHAMQAALYEDAIRNVATAFSMPHEQFSKDYRRLLGARVSAIYAAKAHDRAKVTQSSIDELRKFAIATESIDAAVPAAKTDESEWMQLVRLLTPLHEGESVMWVTLEHESLQSAQKAINRIAAKLNWPSKGYRTKSYPAMHKGGEAWVLRVDRFKGGVA